MRADELPVRDTKLLRRCNDLYRRAHDVNDKEGGVAPWQGVFRRLMRKSDACAAKAEARGKW